MATLEEVAANLGLASTASLNATAAILTESEIKEEKITDDIITPSPDQKRGRGRPRKGEKVIRVETKKISQEGKSPGRPCKTEEEKLEFQRLKQDRLAAKMLEGADGAESPVGRSRRSIRLKTKPQRKYTPYGFDIPAEEEDEVKKERVYLPQADAVKLSKNIPQRKRKKKMNLDPVHDVHVMQCQCASCKQQKGLPLKKRKCDIKKEEEEGVSSLEASQVESVESLTTKDGKPALADDMFTGGAKIFMITIRHKKKASAASKKKKNKGKDTEGGTVETKGDSFAVKKRKKKKKKLRTVALIPQKGKKRKPKPEIVMETEGDDDVGEAAMGDECANVASDLENNVQKTASKQVERKVKPAVNAPPRPKISIKSKPGPKPKKQKPKPKAKEPKPPKTPNGGRGRPRKDDILFKEADIDYRILNEHTMKVTEEVKGEPRLLWKCKFCQVYKTQQDLNVYTHVQLHLQGKLSCMECNYHTNNRTVLSAHVARYHVGKADFICAHCPKQFFSKRDLDAHEASVHHTQSHKHPCPHCDGHWPTSKKLKDHILKEHKGEGLYRCEECNRGFIFKAWYERHFQWCGHRHSQCPYCDQVLVDPHARNLHIRRIHQRKKKKVPTATLR